MRKDISQKILNTQESVMEDEIYCRLMEEHALRNARFLEVMESLPKDQQDTIYDYLGVIVEMHLRMLELACE